MAEARPKSGKVELREYEADSYLRQLEPVVQRLEESVPEARYDRKGLGLLIGQVLNFMEDALGVNAIAPRPFPKIPAKLFQDVAPNGSVYAFALECWEIRKARNLKRIEWANPMKRKETLEILSIIRKGLAKRGLLHTPKVFIDPSCKGEAPALQQMVAQLQGDLAVTADTPGITHFVVPFGPGGDPDDGVQYQRVFKRRGPEAYVHWWYYPDSYDEWIPSEQAGEQLDSDDQGKGPWKVYARWLRDSAKYNEWMNPIDYEPEEPGAEGDAAGKPGAATGNAAPAGAAVDAAGAKRKLEAAGEENAAKKAKVDVPAAAVVPAMRRIPAPMPRPEIDPSTAERLGPNVVRRKVVNPDRKVVDGTATTENLSQGQQRKASGSRVPQATPPVEPASGRPPTTNGLPLDQPQPMKELYRVPTHAAWFDYVTVHAIERSAMPSFFNSASESRTPRIYKEYRNWMINKYREDTSRVLTATECRRGLAGDAMAIQQVWAFLDEWGLINFQARPDADKFKTVDISALGLPPGATVRTTPAAPSTEALFKFSRPTVAGGQAAISAGGGGDMAQLITRKDHYNRTPADAPTTQPRFFCNAMPWVDCTAVRYHCTKYPDVDLCPEAYANGHFPPACTAKDFVRIDQADEPSGPDWTDQETLLLLEGLEIYGDNWGEIAEHVGTKSQLQCIMHFVRLPIEDQFLNEVQMQPPAASTQPQAAAPQLPGRGSHAAAGAAGQLPEAPTAAKAGAIGFPPAGVSPDNLPFDAVGNVLLSQLQMLASLVSPKVGAAAAQAALEALCEEDPDVAAEAGLGMAAQQASAGPNGHSANGVAGQAGFQGDGPPSAARVRIAAATAIASAAVKAKLLADEEEMHVQHGVERLLTLHHQKVELKLKHCEQVDQALERERAQIEMSRHAITAEILQLQEQKAAALRVLERPIPGFAPQGLPGSQAINPSPQPQGSALSQLQPHVVTQQQQHQIHQQMLQQQQLQQQYQPQQQHSQQQQQQQQQQASHVTLT
ncbi:hypothetical protein WJX72_010310 [[Myrmecia] bisecta]|uniref:Uncharacterized protein n=1 Tax=[Myrmecia] bisecta TaxID=41462 RepID=A0AAW1R989_9CHLO